MSGPACARGEAHPAAARNTAPPGAAVRPVALPVQAAEPAILAVPAGPCPAGRGTPGESRGWARLGKAAGIVRPALPVLAVLLALAAAPPAVPMVWGAGGGAPDPAALLGWAHRLIDGVNPEANEYDSHPTIVSWAGVGGASETRNRSVCSSLVAHLMMQAYGYSRADFKGWMHTTFPQAMDFHDAIADGNGFDRVTAVASIRPGDIVAIKYPPGHHPTGHVLVVAAPPVARTASEPLLPQTRQYEMQVIDSSRTGHGPQDTRHYAKGRYHSGVGQGTMRLYVDGTGAIAAYSWSITRLSTIYTPGERNLVIGRLNGKIPPTGGHGAANGAEGEEPAGDVEPPSQAPPG